MIREKNSYRKSNQKTRKVVRGKDRETMGLDSGLGLGHEGK